MALINLTLMLLLTSFIDCEQLSINEGQHKGHIYLNNNKETTEKLSSTEKLTPIIEGVQFFPLDHIVESDIMLEQQYRLQMQTSNDPNDQVEDIQSDDVVESNDVMLEEQFRHPKFSIQMQNEIFDEDIEVHSEKLNESHLLTIFSCLLAILSVGAILSIISWRSYIKTHYGMRHRLVPSEELNINNDERIHL